MTIFQALDRVLGHIGPLALERQLLEQSGICLLDSVNLLLDIGAELLVRFILNNVAFESPC